MNASAVIQEIASAVEKSGAAQRWEALRLRAPAMPTEHVNTALRDIAQEATNAVQPLASQFMTLLSKALGAHLASLPANVQGYKQAVLETDQQWRRFHAGLPYLAQRVVDVDGFKEGRHAPAAPQHPCPGVALSQPVADPALIA